MSIKVSSLAVIAILTAITLGGVTVMGILEDAERVTTSGVIVIPAYPAPFIPMAPPPPPSIPDTPSPPPPSEPVIEIGVFSNEECTNPLSSIEWGTIEAGYTSSITIYLMNSGEESAFLSLQSDNWSPVESTGYMSLSWDYDGTQITSGEIKEITIDLSVNSNCPDFDDFNFDIIIICS